MASTLYGQSAFGGSPGRGWCLAVLLMLIAYSLPAQESTVRNDVPRRDVNGDIIDAHDGRVVAFGGTFYWYGTAYGNTSGFTRANSFRVYSSGDLVRWRPGGKLLAKAPEGVYYRPHVIYNARTRKYVLWYNWYPVLWKGQIGVAVSDSPAGPFIIHSTNVSLKYSNLGVGDLYLFADEDGTAYVSYNTIEGHKISVEKLSPDYLSSTLENGGFLAEECEASAMFKRDGKYYLLTDNTCCFCSAGTGARQYVSDSPLSGYRYRGNINRYPGVPHLAVLDGETGGLGTVEVQENQYLHIRLPALQKVDSIRVFFPTGNRRTHCDPAREATIRHPDEVVPRFAVQFREAGGWQAPAPSATATSNLNRTNVTRWQYPAPACREIRFNIAQAAYTPVPVAEVEVYAGGKNVALAANGGQAFLAAGEEQAQNSNPIIIAAQQTSVIELPTAEGPKFIWMGDLWGSRPDNVKGHDFQYWSAPLEFEPDGTIRPLRWDDHWTVRLAQPRAGAENQPPTRK